MQLGVPSPALNNPPPDADDGVFWMAFSDFAREFGKLSSIILAPTVHEGGPWLRTALDATLDDAENDHVWAWCFSVAVPTPLLVHVEQTQAPDVAHVLSGPPHDAVPLKTLQTP